MEESDVFAVSIFYQIRAQIAKTDEFLKEHQNDTELS
jgi:hypothetical protein